MLDPMLNLKKQSNKKVVEFVKFNLNKPIDCDLMVDDKYNSGRKLENDINLFSKVL